MADTETILTGLKAKGIECALIRKDGLMIYSTLTLDETTPNIISALTSITDELMRQVSDKQKEIEVSIDSVYFVVLPINSYLLCGVVKERDAKKEMRAVAEQLKTLL